MSNRPATTSNGAGSGAVPGPVLTSKAVAELLGVSTTTLRNWISKGLWLKGDCGARLTRYTPQRVEYILEWRLNAAIESDQAFERTTSNGWKLAK